MNDKTFNWMMAAVCGPIALLAVFGFIVAMASGHWYFYVPAILLIFITFCGAAFGYGVDHAENQNADA